MVISDHRPFINKGKENEKAKDSFPLKESKNYAANITTVLLIKLIKCQKRSYFTFLMFHAYDVQEFCFQMGMLFFSKIKVYSPFFTNES